MITAIMAGSPAATAGLHQGDVVEEVDSQPVDPWPTSRRVSTPAHRERRSADVGPVRPGQMTTMTLAVTPTG